jgi:hypothetical protein
MSLLGWVEFLPCLKGGGAFEGAAFMGYNYNKMKKENIK